MESSGWAGLNRSCPTGGRAYGMPRKATAPSFNTLQKSVVLFDKIRKNGKRKERHLPLYFPATGDRFDIPPISNRDGIVGLFGDGNQDYDE